MSNHQPIKIGRTWYDYIILALKGISMGAADVIPGVSGGTIAFISGIYEELVRSISSINGSAISLLFRRGPAAAWSHINGNFLLSLGLGIGISLITLSRFITALLAHHPILVWSFFFGLILASIWFVGRKIKSFSFRSVMALLVGLGLGFYITIAAPASTPEDWWFIFVSGLIAICAMILPGISGSFILLLLGKYQFIMEAIKGLHAKTIIVFAAGCIM
jgi:putative membrane protein